MAEGQVENPYTRNRETSVILGLAGQKSSLGDGDVWFQLEKLRVFAEAGSGRAAGE